VRLGLTLAREKVTPRPDLSQIPESKRLVLWFNEIGKEDVGFVGGKCANLGEMVTKANVPVPGGFAITAYAYQFFLERSGIRDHISSLLSDLDVRDLKLLNERASRIREIIKTAGCQTEIRAVPHRTDPQIADSPGNLWP